MDFVPDNKGDVQDVPFFDDVIASEGWQGHSTSKSIDTLKSEITQSISRLGGMVASFQKGTFTVGEVKRDGYQVRYTIEDAAGNLSRGQIDVAALPVRSTQRNSRSLGSRREKSLKMALFMLRIALNGTWFLQQLSPGYSPLMPWMIEEETGKTFSQLWSERSDIGLLVAPSGAEVTDGTFEVVE